MDISPEYLGVGYVIGPRIAGEMFAGGVLSWLVLLPLLSIAGQYITVPFPPIHPNFANNPATGQPFLISEMSPAQIWSAYIRYIGAGAVLAGGLITLSRTIPTIVSSAIEGLKSIGGGAAGAGLRTEREIPDERRPHRIAAARALPCARSGDAAPGQRPRGPADRGLQLLLLDGFVANHRADRLIVESDFRA